MNIILKGFVVTLVLLYVLVMNNNFLQLAICIDVKTPEMITMVNEVNPVTLQLSHGELVLLVLDMIALNNNF